MIEHLNIWSFYLTDPDETAALSTTAIYTDALVPMTIVGVAAAPLEDDASATLDINGGSSAITGIDVSDKDVPGTWKSTHLGGTKRACDGFGRCNLEF